MTESQKRYLLALARTFDVPARKCALMVGCSITTARKYIRLYRKRES